MEHRIAQAAERSGVPATTIRYYEQAGLIRPAARAANGYRLYSDRDVARLRFVRRARALELPVDDLAELVALWERDRCAPVAQRLRDQIADRLADTQRRIADLAALAGELQRVRARLQDPPPEGPCIEGECVCFDDTPRPGSTDLPLVEPYDGDVGPGACTLAPAAMPQRMADWQRLLARTVRQGAIPGGVSLEFPHDADLAGELAALATAEQDCCAFFQFGLHVTADALHLEVTGPAEAQNVIASVFGAPRPTDSRAPGHGDVTSGSGSGHGPRRW